MASRNGGGYSRQHLNRLATSAYLQAIVEPLGSDEIAETHLRPLTSLPTDEIRKQIWDEVKAKHGKVTAKVIKEAVDDWKAKNVVVADDLPCKLESEKMIQPIIQTEPLAQEWGALILENSAVIATEQKKTADAKRQIKKLKAEQKDLVLKGVATTLTNVATQMALAGSYLAILED